MPTPESTSAEGIAYYVVGKTVAASRGPAWKDVRERGARGASLYSERSATMGSTCVARRAGTSMAISDTTLRIAATVR